MVTGLRAVGLATALVVGGAAFLGAGPGQAAAAGGAITFDAPNAPTAGTVRLTGTVGLAPGEVDSVMYVFDATNSTASPAGSDCSGNGTVGSEDDFNADGSVGDVLDCEIAGVVALNHSVATTSGLQAGVVAFANRAVAADLDPVGSATFLPPSYTGGDARPRVETVARSVTQGRIGLYDEAPLGGSGAGTAFNNAIRVALSALASAPPGPKQIMFLSDGQSPIDDDVLAQLTASGVELRSFGVGAGASCATFGSLYKMASATGEACTVSPTPASLVAGLTGSDPDAILGVTVSIRGVAVAADLNAFGGWTASFDLGAGTYTATATATLASGASPAVRRTFVVTAASDSPDPGTVRPSQGGLNATVVKVDPPAPTRSVLPKRVTGVAGVPRPKLTTTRKLSGAHVLLQARAALGDPWTTVAHDRVNRAGGFALTWHPKLSLRYLRVTLLPHGKYASSAAAVPSPEVSACRVKKHGAGWSVTCLTTVRSGSTASRLADGRVVDRARVHDGGFRLHGHGSVSGHAIALTAGGRHLRLDL